MLSLLLQRHPDYKDLIEKVHEGKRLYFEDGLRLFNCDNLNLLGHLANLVRERLHRDKAYFIRNFHINSTNICIYTCSFCSFARKPGREGGYEMSLEDVYRKVHEYDNRVVNELHIVNGVHPKLGIDYYAEMLRGIKKIRPDLHLKTFTAVEIPHMAKRSKMTIEQALRTLKEAGMDSMPGGGAEIFHPEIREQICEDKADQELWLEVHRTAHKLGIHTTCTMLYGHIERYEHRIHHMLALRDLQDETGGFTAFIPLKFHNENNDMSDLSQTSVVDDLKTYAVSRLMMDNIPHLKAYWIMISPEVAQLALSYGVDDIDGTVVEEKIYHMAGAKTSQEMARDELIRLIREAGRHPIERDSLYGIVEDLGEPGEALR